MTPIDKIKKFRDAASDGMDSGVNAHNKLPNKPIHSSMLSMADTCLGEVIAYSRILELLEGCVVIDLNQGIGECRTQLNDAHGAHNGSICGDKG